MSLFYRVNVSICLVFGLLALSSCSFFGHTDSATASDTPSATKTATTQPTTKPSTSASAKPTPPVLSASASQIDCQDGPGVLMWQADHISGNVAMKVADLQCESGGPKFGQVIETFTLLNGKWVSQGLASGPDISMRTIGECTDHSVNKISCPAQALSEDGNQVDAYLFISIGVKDTTWQFGGAA